MKKIIIVVLLLIPIIVLLTISVSGKIISAEVSIAIESFELWHKGEPVTEAVMMAVSVSLLYRVILQQETK